MKVSTGKLHIPHPGNTPIVNHLNFTDATPPTINSVLFNPGAKSAPLPNGPSKYVPGEPRVQRNVKRNLTNPNPPY